ncbi:hypothetical protein WME90_42040 [Sorangium sp. So ce375]|uniref:hypothetical protein n=1 Tax=Sorangium sp. So ce375 TaxID=3133306 RepID=UPI003F5BA619
MVVLKIRPNETAETTDPHVQITLEAGVYRFELVVLDKKGNKSQPVELQIVVQK